MRKIKLSNEQIVKDMEQYYQLRLLAIKRDIALTTPFENSDGLMEEVNSDLYIKSQNELKNVKSEYKEFKLLFSEFYI